MRCNFFFTQINNLLFNEIKNIISTHILRKADWLGFVTRLGCYFIINFMYKYVYHLIQHLGISNNLTQKLKLIILLSYSFLSFILCLNLYHHFQSHWIKLFL